MMKPVLFTSWFCLVLSTQLSLARGDSQIFSQYAGAPTVTAAFTGSAASYLSGSFTICTNYLHGLPALSGYQGSIVAQLEQEAADGVCQFCTSLDLSRIDSCCAQPTSSLCFDQFAAQTDPITSMATAAATATATATASTPTNTKASNGNRVDAVSSNRPPLVLLGTNGH
jgi:hypothetical protein